MDVEDHAGVYKVAFATYVAVIVSMRDTSIVLMRDSHWHVL